MPDGAGYPTDEELTAIWEWNFKQRPLVDFMQYIRSLWWQPDWGYLLREKKHGLYLELHTGGWSGNESIIAALEENYIFWSLTWQKSTRGGHYYFKIDIRQFEP